MTKIMFYSNQDDKNKMHYAPGVMGGNQVNLNAYDPSQPRDPKGSDTGGQWTRKSPYNLGKLSDLLAYLSDIPVGQREISDFPFQSLVVYHITKSKNIDEISKSGITARSSSQSYDRPSSVYFFADKSELTQENIDILGLHDGYKILRVKIPVESVMKSMIWDGLYNMGFGTRSAVQYFDSVPKEWIVSWDYKV